MTDKKPVWNDYDVEFTLLTSLCSSVPADPEVMRAWIASRQPKVKPAGAKTITQDQRGGVG